MTKKKKENWAVALIIIGMFAMLVCAIVAMMMDNKIVSIVGYVVGGILILTGLIFYFVNYYKPEEFDRIETREIESENDMYNTQKHVNADMSAPSYKGTGGEIVFEDEEENVFQESISESNFDNTEKINSEDDFYSEESVGRTEDDVNSVDLFEVNKNYKQNYKTSSFGEKLMMYVILWFTVGSMAILFLTFFFVRNHTLYWILITYGMSTFAGTIIICILSAIIQRQRFLNYLRRDNSDLYAKCDIAEGTVINCKLYSHATNSIKKGPYSNRHINKIVVEVTKSSFNNSSSKPLNVVRMLTLHEYNVGAKVKFYQKLDNPKKCYIIEDKDIM